MAKEIEAKVVKIYCPKEKPNRGARLDAKTAVVEEETEESLELSRNETYRLRKNLVFLKKPWPRLCTCLFYVFVVNFARLKSVFISSMLLVYMRPVVCSCSRH